ncbi:hypothetical protein [Halopiger aswanensis]|uniref:Uncharacterized protein n=1 Tax=Halopiger aswanensis TaxID=148449 RepID=A0A3R7DFQ8_9EURY|nr:hypothetical protein [Halopiger aswanensis]RKD98132.1 hypothetical protein ATJ93_1136 [Halopiger aswanensis]
MNRRYAIVGIVVLLAAATTGMLAGYSPTDATASSPATPTGLEGSYTVTETVLVDGDRFFERESIVDAETGAQRSVLLFEDSSYDSYWTGDGERYTKVAFESEARLEEWLAGSEDEVVRTVDDEHGAILAASDGAADRADGPVGDTFPDRLSHSQLEMAAFTETDETTVDGTTVETYEPRTGWIDVQLERSSHETVYVADADGEVRVGPDGRLRHANVTVERVDAETWGEYLLERGESYATTFEYDVAESTENVRPEWLDDVPSE